MELFSTALDENISRLNELFFNCGDYVSRKFTLGEHNYIKVFVAYIDGMVARSVIENSILNNLIVQIRQAPPSDIESKNNIFKAILDGGFATADTKEISTFEEAKLAILSGDCVFLINGFSNAIVVASKGWSSRGVTETDSEKVIQGPKEAFSEGLRINTALIRRRIRDTHLKVKQIMVGRRSNTDIAIVYLEGVARLEVIREVEKKLNSIDIDAILDSSYIEQLTEKNIFSPFPLSQVTERPDKAASAILEGRVVVIVDNSPFVIIVPATINTFLQSSEDYYQRWQIMSFIRLLRYLAAFFTICLPGLYIAFTVFHPSMLPTTLALKMAAARNSIPFPAVMEIIIMELAFELLREAGTRLPSAVGSTMGIVGGLIVGQAAVEAGLVSPIVVIVVATTAISSFAVPNVSLVSAFRLIKFYVIILSSTLGLFGFWLSTLSVLTHLSGVKSYGFPYLFPYSSSDVNSCSDIKDSLFRLPIFFMKKRPLFANPNQTKRAS